MPDWSYQTLFRPLLFRFPAPTARQLTLATTAGLAAIPMGKSIIDLFGHMQPPGEVRCSAMGLDFSSPVGLGTGIDPQAIATAAFSRFGFGFVEVGPVTLQPVTPLKSMSRLGPEHAIWYFDCPANQGLTALENRLKVHGELPYTICIRLGYQPGSKAVDAARERRHLIQSLAPYAQFFVLESQPELTSGAWTLTDWADHLKIVGEAQLDRPVARPILINLRPDLDLNLAKAVLAIALEHQIAGVVVGGGMRTGDGGRLLGSRCYQPGLAMVRFLQAEYGRQLTIIGSGGIEQPREALAFLDAGATLVQVDSGFIYSGPGLPKRINEAIACYRPSSIATFRTPPENIPFYARAWFWAAALGLALIISGLVVGIVAVTRTVLPYDEAFAGMTREALMAINPRLLPFMTHDRATVAGTMLSTGVLYVGLALGGMRSGHKWARHAVSVSAISGFASFFLFLGFGYFDPLHAVLTASLLPLLVLSRLTKMTPVVPRSANLVNNRRWFIGQWGQFLFITIGIGLLLAGGAITFVGVSHIFVPEDLHYLDTTAAVLNSFNNRLLPLIAHDRVGFGGNLISIGFGVLLLSLWGFRQGERWVWWTLALAGLPGFVAGIGIHLVVGYLDLWHLFPAFVALAFFVIGLVLAFPYLNDTAAVPGERAA